MHQEARARQIEQIFETMRRINKNFHHHLKGEMQKLNITPAQMRILWKVHQHPGISLSELARQTGLAKSNISGVVERMSKDHLLDKQPDREDQRLIRLYLDKPGQSILQDTWATFRETSQRALDSLTPEQLASIVNSLLLLEKALEHLAQNRR